MHVKLFQRVVILMVCLIAVPARAVILNLVAPPGTVTAGSEIRIDLVVLNPAGTEAMFDLPVALAGRLTDGQKGVWAVELQAPATNEPLVVPANGFAVQVYRVRLPMQAIGRLVLDVDRPVGTKLAIETEAGLARNEPTRTPLSSIAPPQTVETVVRRTFNRRFGAHDPVYFIYGADAPAAKFQFSFKYRLFGARSELGEDLPGLRTLYFGYTQRSLWNIDANSSPFYDTSYMPELMFESQSVIDSGKDGGFKFIGYQAGVRHESNGQDGLDSRSMNIAYVRPGFVFGRFDGWHMLVAPRVFAYITDLENNPDIADYRGNVEWLAVVGRSDLFALSLTGRIGRGGHKGSLQADLTIPVEFDRVFDFATYVLIQYWDGYGESLRDYNVRSSTVRVGFSLVR